VTSVADPRLTSRIHCLQPGVHFGLLCTFDAVVLFEHLFVVVAAFLFLVLCFAVEVKKQSVRFELFVIFNVRV